MRIMIVAAIALAWVASPAMARNQRPSAAPEVFLGQAGPSLEPVPEALVVPQPRVETRMEPLPEASPPIIYTEGAYPLFHNVRYRQLRNVHPCAVPMIVSVKDPCRDPCSACCAPGCVAVKICVPPDCCPPDVKIKRNGNRVTYDWGKYAVNVTSYPLRGLIVVDYDD